MLGSPFFPEILKDVPDRFDVFVLIGDIGCIEINPEGDPIGQFFPFLDIFKGGLAR